jgi:predicted kinase
MWRAPSLREAAGCQSGWSPRPPFVEASVIIHINSYPGVGKLTIGRHLAEKLGGRLLDNHSIYNVAFAVTEFRSPSFYQTVRAVRDVAYARVLELPVSTPVVLTNWYSEDSAWGVENWDEIIALARKRGCPLLIVILSCSPEENATRIQSEGRAAKHKPRSLEMVDANRARRALLEQGGDALFRLDVTSLPAEAASQRIADWIGKTVAPAQSPIW